MGNDTEVGQATDVQPTEQSNSTPPEAGSEPLQTPVEEMESKWKAEIETLNQRLDEKHQSLLRVAADLDNLRKRTRRDIEDAQNKGRSEVISALLPAVDGIDLALASSNGQSDAASILEGMDMIRRQFVASLVRFGLKEVQSLGSAFDPNIHEAISQQPSAEYDTGRICAQMRKGYTLADKLIRPALVIVSTGKIAKAEDSDTLTSTSAATEEPPEPRENTDVQ